jgi:hypothetical protein
MTGYTVSSGQTTTAITRSDGDTREVNSGGTAVLLAEGVPAESYLDTGNRGMFENAAAPLCPHPDFADGQRQREARSRAPFAVEPDLVEPVWRRLAARAEVMGWPPPRPVDLTDEPNLRILTGGRSLRPVIANNGRYLFVLPRASETLRRVSRTAHPHAATPWTDDRRRLGVMIRRLTWRHGQDARIMAMDDPTLRERWWQVEWQAHWPSRWTNGDAVLPPLGAGLLEVEVNGSMQYPIDQAVGRDWCASAVTAVAGA